MIKYAENTKEAKYAVAKVENVQAALHSNAPSRRYPGMSAMESRGIVRL